MKRTFKQPSAVHQTPFVVSLVGRPNVGKSTIFNRLMNNSVKAIAMNQEGVTRDRHYGITTYDELAGSVAQSLILVDTGGFFPDEHDSQKQLGVKNLVDGISLTELARQAQMAISESDLVLVVMDIRQGVLAADRDILEYLRREQKEFIVLLNKYDSDLQEQDQFEFFELGVENFHLISAEHSRGIQELKEKIQLKANSFHGKKQDLLLTQGVAPKYPLVGKVAIIGAPNAGKSTLLNQLVGSHRAVVSEKAGTTVDPIEAYFDLNFSGFEQVLDQDFFAHEQDNLSILQKALELESDDEQDLDGMEDSAEMAEISHGQGPAWRSVMVVDTAGIRKMGAVEKGVEQLSVYRSLRAIAESDVVIYMVDALKGITHQDRKLMGVVIDKGASLLIAINKVDLLKDTLNDNQKKRDWVDSLRFKIPWLSFCELIPISAKNAQKLTRLRHVLKKVLLTRHQKLPTAELNRCLNDLISRHTLTVNRSRQTILKLKYATQVKSSPPTIMLVTNRSKDIPVQYRRYLVNGVRTHFGMANTPLHLVFKTAADLK